MYFNNVKDVNKTCDSFTVGKTFSRFLNSTTCTYKLNGYHSCQSILALFKDEVNVYAWYIGSGLRVITNRLYNEQIDIIQKLNAAIESV